jgi:tetratricopeptide (TPR) repeat protein
VLTRKEKRRRDDDESSRDVNAHFVPYEAAPARFRSTRPRFTVTPKGVTFGPMRVATASAVSITIAVVMGVACSRSSGEQPSAIEPATKDYVDAGDAALAAPPPPAPTAAPTTTTSSTSNAAAAEALFQEARKAMSEGKYADACPKLEESQRLDPADGTLLNLATCYEHLGDTAKACTTFAAALKSLRAKSPVAVPREKLVLDRMAALKCSP